MSSPATGDLCRTFLSRRSHTRGMATGASTVRLPTNRETAHQRRHRVGRHATTTDAPTRARTSTRTLTLTHRRSFDGRRRTSPLRPCCCAAARRQRPPRSDECANN
jgi:hypothetical protein